MECQVWWEIELRCVCRSSYVYKLKKGNLMFIIYLLFNIRKFFNVVLNRVPLVIFLFIFRRVFFFFYSFFFYVVLNFAHVCGTRVYWINVLLLFILLSFVLFIVVFSLSLCSLFSKTILLLLYPYRCLNSPFGSPFTHLPL